MVIHKYEDTENALREIYARIEALRSNLNTKVTEKKISKIKDYESHCFEDIEGHLEVASGFVYESLKTLNALIENQKKR